ncbi:POTE ankyrin domain family member J [Labeo rohita]|uniref:POTE ankyrin domain family member J n=1 Tax=Labeo rohita TaxID=84645 RepID=A0ABQ8LSW0_LABRO|nr:POTE ankyrin domain family member J [Labeo rohita]
MVMQRELNTNPKQETSERIFHRFHVSQEDRDYLWCLWWENGDTNSEPKEYRMKVHLFGAASSPGCLKLRLHKFILNNRKVIESIPVSERASRVQDVELGSDELPVQTVLGVKWSVNSDTFSFKAALDEKPAVRRGILSTVASVFDPLGFLAPFLLLGKKRIELHHFSDASSHGYGQCSYIQVLSEDKVHCFFVIGKARIAPSKIVTKPRLELTAVVISSAVSSMLKEELELKTDQEFFWTDSKVVLGYINNEAGRFHVVVANRVQRIREMTDPAQWHYIDTEQNPADRASRGLKVSELFSSNWLTGPKFLWEIVTSKTTPELLVGDPEIRTMQVLQTNVANDDHFLERFSRFSKWYTALKVVTHIQQLYCKCVLKVGGRLKKASLPLDSKHPAELPRHSVVTRLVVDYCHEKTQHQGRGQTLNEFRANGYWVAKLWRARRPTETRMMADLPANRLDPSPPFSYCGMDCFGPFLCKQ